MVLAEQNAYVDIRRALASDRLREVQQSFDALTITRLNSLGVDTGWRCLVVGSGRGSIARWLSERVGELGRIVLAELDPSDNIESNVETRVHDIVEDPMERDTYDLAYSRYVLMTVGDPHRALDNMIASLRPGGWLVVEEGDFGEPMVITREHPAAGAFERVWHAMTAFLADSMDARYGTKLPRIGGGLGLDELHTEATRAFNAGGANAPTAMKVALDVFRPFLLSSTAVWEDDLDLASAALEDPSFVCGSPTSYVMLGRKPER